MGLFWDLVQQSEINKQAQLAATLEERVAQLEAQHAETHALLRTLIERLEQNLRVDLDQDGNIG